MDNKLISILKEYNKYSDKSARGVAYKIKHYFGIFDLAKTPMENIAKAFDLEVDDNDPTLRWNCAYYVGEIVYKNAMEFADGLLAPLSIIEPIIVYGRVETGEVGFFGNKKTRPYTTQEIQDRMCVPGACLERQLRKLLC